MKTRSTIIYNCYDDDIFKNYKDEKRIFDFVFLGRLVSQKGCDLLINACANLKRSFTLNIIGDGPERSRLEKMVKNLCLEKEIKFLGILEGELLARTLNRHKTMVVPSIGEEGFGIVVLEGMACGCRIIASDAGGLIEAISGHGKIFKMKDQQELECILVEELNKFSQIDDDLINTDYNDYLSLHKKEVIARKYLLLFE